MVARSQAALGMLLFVLWLPASAGDALTSVPIFDSGKRTYYVSVDIEEAGTHDYLVDTGASYMTIGDNTRVILERKGLATRVGEIYGVLANEKRMVVPVYRVSQITIAGSCTVEDVEVAVLPKVSRGLLGLSVLKKTAPFSVSLEPPTLQLSNCAKPL